jgi:hypothetical protein
MILAPAVEISRRRLVFGHFTGQGAQQQRVVAEGAEERQQLLARATAPAANEGAPQR